ALVRVCSLPERSTEVRLAQLQKALELATRDEDKRLVFEGLGTVKSIETLRFVVPLLEDKALAQGACKAVVELAHSKTLREPHKAEFEKALDRVIAVCMDKGLVERAKQYKREL